MSSYQTVYQLLEMMQKAAELIPPQVSAGPRGCPYYQIARVEDRGGYYVQAPAEWGWPDVLILPTTRAPRSAHGA